MGGVCVGMCTYLYLHVFEDTQATFTFLLSLSPRCSGFWALFGFFFFINLIECWLERWFELPLLAVSPEQFEHVGVMVKHFRWPGWDHPGMTLVGNVSRKTQSQRKDRRGHRWKSALTSAFTCWCSRGARRKVCCTALPWVQLAGRVPEREGEKVSCYSEFAAVQRLPLFEDGGQRMDNDSVLKPCQLGETMAFQTGCPSLLTLPCLTV